MGHQECPLDLRELVVRPNFSDPDENAKRRALLLLRHLALWNEIPGDTDWYEVDINERALEHVRVFPRAQWRKLARGNFSVTTVTDGIRARRIELSPRFHAKLLAIGDQLSKDVQFGAVILLGMSEDKPVTVLDGNHRLVAAMLSSTRRAGEVAIHVRVLSANDAVLLVQDQYRNFGQIWMALAAIGDPQSESGFSAPTFRA